MDSMERHTSVPLTGPVAEIYIYMNLFVTELILLVLLLIIIIAYSASNHIAAKEVIRNCEEARRTSMADARTINEICFKHFQSLFYILYHMSFTSSPFLYYCSRSCTSQVKICPSIEEQHERLNSFIPFVALHNLKVIPKLYAATNDRKGE